MPVDESAIINLLSSYAEFIDSGQLERAAGLFDQARIKIAQYDEPQSAEVVLAMWKRMIKIYACGNPARNMSSRKPS